MALMFGSLLAVGPLSAEARGEDAPTQEYPQIAGTLITHEEVLVSKPDGDGMTAYEPLDQSSDGHWILDPHSNPQWVYQINAEYTLPGGTLTETVCPSPAQGCTWEYVLPAGFGVRGVVPDHEYVLKDTVGQTMGTYRMVNDERGTRFLITFNKDTILRNRGSETIAGQPVEGWMSTMISLDENLLQNGAVITLPGGEQEITVRKVRDLHVDKKVGDPVISADGSSRTLPYTITVTTEHGTPDRIHLTDVVRAATILPGTVTIKKQAAGSTGQSIDVMPTGQDGGALTADGLLAADGTLDCWLPKLEPGESYVITYDAQDQVPVNQSAAVGNTVTVESKNEEQSAKDTAVTERWMSNQPYMGKQSDGRSADGQSIRWKVTVNGGHANLNGWQWSDVPGEGLGDIADLRLCDGDGKNCRAVDSLPLTFTDDDYRSYVITYGTPITAWDQNEYRNVARLCREEACTTKVETAGTYKFESTFTKQGTLLSQTTKDGKRVALQRWTITAGGDEGFPSNPTAQEWTFTDTLQQPYDGSYVHYLTDAQREALADAVAQAIRTMVATVDVTPETTEVYEERDGKKVHVGFDIVATAPTGGASAKQVTATVRFETDAEGRTVKFKIGADTRFPEGRTATFTYETTAEFTSSTAGTDIFNCVTDDMQQSCPKVWAWDYEPADRTPDDGKLSVGKRDTGKDKSQQVFADKAQVDGNYPATEHYYDGLYISRITDAGGNTVRTAPYLEWTVDVVPDLSQVDQKLTIVEELPAGTRLLTGTAVDAYSSVTDNVAGLGIQFGHYQWIRGNHNYFQLDAEHDTGQAWYEEGDWGNPTKVPYATATYDTDSNQVTIEITPAFLKQHKKIVENLNWQGQRISIVVRVELTDLGNVPDGRTYANYVTVTQGDGQALYAQQKQTVKRDFSTYGGKEVLNKVSQYDKESGLIATRNAIDYELSVNPQTLCLDQTSQGTQACSPSTLTVTDVMKYRRELGYDDSEFVLDPESVHVFRDARCLAGAKADGSCERWEPGTVTISRVAYHYADQGATYTAKIKYCKQEGSAMGNENCQTQKPYPMDGWDQVPETETAHVVELSQGDYTYEVASTHATDFIEEYLHEVPPKYTQEWSNTLIFHVPNEQALTIRYEYKGYGNPQAWVGASNEMSFGGSAVFKPTDESFAVNLASATAGAQISGLSISLQKIDGLDGHVLSGAEFRLDGYVCEDTEGEDGGHAAQCAWQTVDEQVTIGENALVLSTGTYAGDWLVYNRAYRLVETKAPEGYPLPTAEADRTTVFTITKIKPNTNMIPADGYPWQCPTKEVDGKEELACGESKPNGGRVWIKNMPPVLLPQAGGSGNATSLVALGVAVVLLGLAAAVRARRLSFQTSEV